MTRRDFLAAFPAFACLPFVSPLAVPQWQDDKLVIQWPSCVITPEQWRRLLDSFRTLNATPFAGEQPGRVMFADLHISARLPPDGTRRVATLTFRRNVPFTASGIPGHRSTDFTRLT